MQRDVTDFSFLPMTMLKAYVLGFAWADGSINILLTTLSFVSKDDLSSLRDVFYPKGDRPVYQRSTGAYQLNVNSRRIVQELVQMGFTPHKSKEGKPLIPPSLERYFLLGLLDGDGCVYSTNKRISVFYCGNRETMVLIQEVIQQLTDIYFDLRQPRRENVSIQGRPISNNHICHTLQITAMKESRQFLSWLYKDIECIPYLQRKYQKFLEFQRLYQSEIKCFLCATPVSRNGTTVRYCPECRLLLRRLSNRRSDHEGEKWLPLLIYRLAYG